MRPWKHLKEPEVIKVGWRTLVRKTFERPDGIPAEYVTYDAPEGKVAMVIALTPDNKVIVAEQFRPGPEEYFQDLPGGDVDKGEEPIEAVIRELREEVGCESSSVKLAGTAVDSYRNATWYYFIARGCQLNHEQELDDGEFVTPKLISIDQLYENARTRQMGMGEITGVFLAHDILQKIKEEKNS